MGIKLEIGCGRHPKEGYEHLDIQPFPHVEYVADARKIPLPDLSVSEIYTSNVIEHFWWFEIGDLLKEWYRVIEVGGFITIYTPDAEFCIKQFLSGEWKEEVEACPKEKGYWWVYGSDADRNMWLNFKLHGTNAPGNAHLTAFSQEMLENLLRQAGFKDIVRMNGQDTTIAIRGIK